MTDLDELEREISAAIQAGSLPLARRRLLQYRQAVEEAAGGDAETLRRACEFLKNVRRMASPQRGLGQLTSLPRTPPSSRPLGS